MNRPAPARADEELDVVLDGHRHLYASELGPAVEAARLLGAELRAIQIPPEVAERHIAMALARARYAAVRARWRSARRLAVAAVAAAVLVVGPAAMLAAGALPGDPLYPLKRTIEAADVGLAFSPASEARAHTRIAGSRLHELHMLYAKGRTNQIAGAIAALNDALTKANAAVARAMQAEGPTGETSALAFKLAEVRQSMVTELNTIAQGETVVVSDEIAQQVHDALHDALATTTTKVAPASSIPGAPSPPSQTTGSTAPPVSGGGAANSTEPPTTEPPTTEPPTTEPPTTASPPASGNQPGGDPGGESTGDTSPG
jgi:hypothetical protein